MKGSRLPLLVALALASACGDNLQPVVVGPEVDDLSFSTLEDTPATQTLVVRNVDDVTQLALSDPPHGTVTRQDLVLTYTPDPDYVGLDQIVVTATQDGATVTATVAITVTPVNDAPVGVDDGFAGAKNTASVLAQAVLLANDTDVDGDTLSVTAVGGATGGTVALTGTSVTFTPTTGFTGDGPCTDTLSVGTATDTATVTIAFSNTNSAPVAVDDAATLPEDTIATFSTLQLTTNDTDADGNTLMVTTVGSPTNGTVALVGSDAVFTPDANYNGPATFTYTVSDGTLTDVGLVTLTYTAVDDAPIVADDDATTPEDTALVIPVGTLLGNDSEVDGQTLTVASVQDAGLDTVALAGGMVTFTPRANFNGTATFGYTVTDGGLQASGTVTVVVTAVADAPVAVDDTASTPRNTPVSIARTTLLANDTDVDGQTLTVTSVQGAVQGAVTLDATSAVFTPATGYAGAASFTYTITDGALTDTATVTITVIAPNCGNGTLDQGETCDDGGTTSGNGCSDSCQVEVGFDCLGEPSVCTTACGDGITAGAEACDDDDLDSGDGCSSSCQVEVGFGCTGEPSVCTTACGDGITAGAETCDDDGTSDGDGCSAGCQEEPGFDCVGTPSVCTTPCGDGITAGTEACDDGNEDETDGCTTACVVGATCEVTAIPGAVGFAGRPTTGHCYASFNAMTTFADAQVACLTAGGYLTTITSASESATVLEAKLLSQNPWIGATDDANDTDAVFTWVTGEPWNFTSFEPGQPDDDFGLGGNGECLHINDITGGWNDTNCNISSFVVGRICEFEPDACGDGFVQAAIGEQCDDGNAVGGDGCSATCQIVPLVSFAFTGAAGDETTFNADAPTPASLASRPAMTRGAGISGEVAANAFSSTGFSQAATIDLTDFYTFTVTPAGGAMLAITALEFDERRSNSGPLAWAVRSSLDGFAADLRVVVMPDDDLVRADQRISLGAAFAAVTTPVTFRIYGYDADLAAGTWRLDNVELFARPVTP